jgi:cysteinyl-tRNA synthetase
MRRGHVPLTLYNTLTRRKEPFEPIDQANVRMYVCGPTVYDYAHIGNARPVIVFDVLFRLLRHAYGAGHVTYVRNITDVDDKINARAAKDFPDQPLNEAIRRVTTATERQFHEDIAALGVLPPTVEPRATEFVLPRADGKADMVSLIQALIERGHAYEANGEILFDVESMPDYGRLSRRNLDEQQAGARVAVDAHKKNPADFVLWKESSPDEPGWPADFKLRDGRTVSIRGRPGWHIECSAMSVAYVGEVFDIHGGGLDLIFPHHENEIAQSRCAHGTEVMANYWMHNGFLQVEGQKMSKSLGNFYSIHELLETETFGGRKWPGEVVRLAMLMTHYREPIDFSVRKLEEAANILTAVQRWAFAEDEVGFIPDYDPLATNENVLAALLDDLNTPAAMQAMQRVTSQLGDRNAQPEPLHNQRVAELRQSLRLLGFSVEADGGLRQLAEAAIPRRLAFIREKNWVEADRIREELLQQGIQLKDGKDPATGERVTTWEVKR